MIRFSRFAQIKKPRNHSIPQNTRDMNETSTATSRDHYPCLLWAQLLTSHWLTISSGADIDTEEFLEESVRCIIALTMGPDEMLRDDMTINTFKVNNDEDSTQSQHIM